MPKELNLLILEDSPQDAEMIVQRLVRAGFALNWVRVDSEAAFLSRLHTHPPDVILSDHNMPQFSGTRAAELLRERGLDVPFILVTGSVGEEAAVEVMKKGATDYLLKDRIGRLDAAVERALEEKRLRDSKRRAEDELRATHIRLKHLLENSPAVIYTLKTGTPEATPVIISENVEMLWGYTAAEMLRPDWWEKNLHPADQSRVWASVPRTLATGAGTLEYRLRHKDGSYHWVEDKKKVVRDANGAPVEIVGVVTDINERKRAESHTLAFARLGNRLNSAKTAVEAGEVIVDVADHLFGWDSCALDLYDARTDLTYHILNWDTKDGKRQSFIPRLDGVPPTPRGVRVIREGGQLILREPPLTMGEGVAFGDEQRPSASIMLVPIRDGAQVVGILAIHSYKLHAYTRQDLNELQSLADHCGGALSRIQAETALRDSEERFRQLVDNVKEVFWMTDVSNGEVIYVSPSYEHVWGRERESIYQSLQSWVDALHPEDRDRVMKAVGTRTSTGGYDEQYRIRRPDGTERWIRDRGFPVRNLEGKVYRMAGIAEDITERRELEEQLRQSQKLDLLGQLAGGVAHDFNNILAVIQGLGSMIRATPGLERDILEAADQMVQATERGAGLTQQLLAFSRRQMVEPRDLDLNEIIGNLTKMLKRMVGSENEVQVKPAARLPLVRADAVMMQQVIMNLAVNARDAMTGGGRITIETRFEALRRGHPELNTDAKPGDYVCVSVTDTGSGIPEDVLPKIFEPFFTTKEVGRGTGLGLATVYGIVRQHGGWIKVHSRLQQGTTFRIYLPPIPSSNPASASPPLKYGGDETILVAEDEASLRGLIRTILGRHGYKVLEADSGPAAVEVWRQHRDEVDLLFTDMMMPGGMSGKDLADQLLSEKPKLRVIYNSAHTADIVGVSQDVKEGINYLQKPYSLLEMVRVVREALDGGR